MHGHHGADFDTGRGVTHDVVETHAFEVIENALYAFFGESIFVAGLGGCEYEQVVALLVFDQGLIQSGFTVDYVDEVIHHAAFASHDQVEVT